MPATLARTGRVNMNRKDISRLIGRVFLEKCAANLLYSVGLYTLNPFDPLLESAWYPGFNP